ETREIPPLDYDLVQRMRVLFPCLHLSVNGGIASLDAAQAFLDAGFDGVMIGRAAYHQPWDILASADARLFGGAAGPSPEEVAREMIPYIGAHCASGGRVHQITRHMHGLFHGRPGARSWRRILSEGCSQPGVGVELIDIALEAVRVEQDKAASAA
ncbi:MAG TPA: tRNA dihydrouridine(20/20a) synthase DusA, partial [Rhodobacteraceae bacterium]|nr:tRNA dihydrouridine(20/20a) synthase DusA [Paracoccaceae bacterium]